MLMIPQIFPPTSKECLYFGKLLKYIQDRQDTPQSYVPINATLGRKTFGTWRIFNPIMKEGLKQGILQAKPSASSKQTYSTHKHKSKEFRINPMYAKPQSNYNKIPVKKNVSQSSTLDQWLYNNLQRIDLEPAILTLYHNGNIGKFMINYLQDEKGHGNIKNIIRREPSYSVKPTGRRYTSFTQCNGFFRDYYRVDGESLCTLDISGCHPLALSLIARSKIYTSSNDYFYLVNGFSDTLAYTMLHKDVLFYQNLLQTDTLKEFLSNSFGMSKQMFLAFLNSSKKRPCKGPDYDWNWAKMRDDLHSVFPTIVDTIAEINDCRCKQRSCKCHATLSKYLYKYESTWVFKFLIPALVQELGSDLFVATLHDAIVVKQSDIDRVIPIFKSVFESKGLTMPYKIKSYGEKLPVDHPAFAYSSRYYN